MNNTNDHKKSHRRFSANTNLNEFLALRSSLKNNEASNISDHLEIASGNNNLTNLLGNLSGLKFEETPRRGQTINSIKYANHTLKNFGFSYLGDLMSQNDEEIQKTLDTIYELIQQRIKDIEFRKETFEKIAKFESDKSMLIQNIERLKEENSGLCKQIGQLSNSFHQHEKKCKAEKEKAISEKEDLIKQLAKANQKYVQFQHEMRKKEVEVNRIKEQLRKPIFDKSGSVKYSAEIISSTNYQGTLTSSGFLPRQNAQNEFITNFTQIMDTNQAKLLEENQQLRNIISYFQNELYNVINETKNEFILRKTAEMSSKSLKGYYESSLAGFDLIMLNKGINQMPIEKINKELIINFKENLRIFRKFWSKMITVMNDPEVFKDISIEMMEIDPNFTKIKCFLDLKNALIGLKKRILDPNNQLSIKQVTKNQEIFFYNSKFSEKKANNSRKQSWLSNNSEIIFNTNPDFESSTPKLTVKNTKNIRQANIQKAFNGKIPINDEFLWHDIQFSPIKKPINQSKADSSGKRNENMAPSHLKTWNSDEKSSELSSAGEASNRPQMHEIRSQMHEAKSQIHEVKPQMHERRKTIEEINKWKIALNSHSINQ